MFPLNGVAQKPLFSLSSFSFFLLHSKFKVKWSRDPCKSHQATQVKKCSYDTLAIFSTSASPLSIACIDLVPVFFFYVQVFMAIFLM